jgi:cyanate permease
MNRPDLSDPDQRRVYRAELRKVYRPWRFTALGLLVVALVGSLWDPAHERIWEILLIVGAVMTLGVIIARIRYHQRRMRDDHQV